MGTSCAITFIHKGRAYVRERGSDGYPSGAGQEIVNEIPTENDAYKDRIKKLEEELGELGEEDLEPYIQRPSRNSGPDPNYDYYYYVDLDSERFGVAAAQFRLWDIPRGDDGEEWIQYIDADGFHISVLRPDTPRQYCYRSMHKPLSVSEDGLAAYQAEASSIDMIDESTWMNSSAGHPSLVLASAITRGLMMYDNGRIYAARVKKHRNVTAILYHNYAEILLRAASPSGFMLSFAPRKSDFPSYPSREPTYTHYRYRGCVVSVVEDCSTPEHLHAAIGLAIQHARDVGKDACTFIIFSIQHIAVAEVKGAVSGTLHVSQSNFQPYMDAFGYEGLEKGLSLAAHYLHPHCIDGGAIKFVSSEANTKNPNCPPLPLDILLRIMELVDIKTYDTLSQVCKALRKGWFQQPRLCDYKIASCRSFEMEPCNYLTGAMLRGLRIDGMVTSLLVYYPVHRFHDDADHRKYVDWYDNSCCPCSHLCVEKKCAKPLQLQAVPGSKNIYKFEDTRMIYGSRGQKNCYGEYICSWNKYMPGLFIMDSDNVCEVCARYFDMKES
ncbi:uncharacterized protein FOMMEDRAFT_30559 [Fomitiporia mediterranea MF3/22]|uniref:uncharacterized protein n=1 Tax=Fomitiporia mediterranea (strain MF3/22) TaxID=694068 RepID=UPI00044095F8|nr:uncharacterized protein FOMMEDRAFT_30559 [Fomitiporia mediterranea MF3/22]EJD00560.1 hypothetical protein FOMMEDRAFT_30559 [Fomitiporia mediterranea MF3/22]